MFDRPRPTSLSLLLAVASALALCVCLVLIASCGPATVGFLQSVSPSPADGSPADGIPSPTPLRPTPTDAVKVTVPAREGAEALLGMWADDQDFGLELGGTGVYSLSYGSELADTGAWSLQEDGSLSLEGQPFDAVPHSNLLLLEGADGTSTFTLHILQKVDVDGNLVPYEPAHAIEAPAIDSSTILSITIADHWTGYSPLAPIEADFRLEPGTDHFSGMAKFSVAGYTEAVTRSVPISVPLSVIDELVALLESTPLEEGEYRAVFNHTDDFPSIIITVEGGAVDFGFASKSQGRGYIPWRVLVDQEHYVTYADTPAQALDLLDPYLAREVQEELFNLALERDR